ncbi:hypothetical protein [Marinitenerispora sediminis]|uniref:Uncharacterized protein n=1 Tax=Marinitenerispora sediminis TaxID=1931232 RepID=A0A368T648_9ACTN|nr:hypothetical protein [Marinitenerispora sediminis]RCV50489.1 hypothetical protein DEF28_17935 [Marinitenerispora sediminis]RCV55470.1 hypothetical protein DEF23_14225 [Marinitenerispora sediminis]RCV59102.1 hypothetical protein DEF24_10910 [Marinitenerispora sediminis]
MPELYTVSIDAVADRTLHGRIHLLGTDAPVFPSVRTFPLQLLVDAWDRMRSGTVSPGGWERWHVTADRGVEIATGMELAAEYNELHALLAGTDVTITADEHSSVVRSFSAAKPALVAKYGIDFQMAGSTSRRGHFIRSVPDFAAFRDRVPRIITSYQVGEANRKLREVPPEVVRHENAGPRPLSAHDFAEFTAMVADTRYLAHMSEGMCWQTPYDGSG